MPWIEEEDQLLKEKLSHFVVTDAKAPAGRPVKVWYRYPELEQRDVQRSEVWESLYPFVTIDLIDVAEALDRAERGGQVRPTVQAYRPPDWNSVAAPGRVHVSEWPVAMNIDYQITTWARNIQHDRQLMRQVWALFPGRYGYIGGKETPYVRPITAQLMNMTPGDRIDEFGKRQFRKMYSLRVFSELWASPICDVGEVTELDFSFRLDAPSDEWFTKLDCADPAEDCVPPG